jgi:predicted Zn-dependent protease
MSSGCFACQQQTNSSIFQAQGSAEDYLDLGLGLGYDISSTISHMLPKTVSVPRGLPEQNLYPGLEQHPSDIGLLVVQYLTLLVRKRKDSLMEPPSIRLRHCFTVIIRWVLLMSVIPVSVGCDETPTGRKQLALLPDAQLAAYGAKTFADLKRTQPMVTDPAINRYVQCMAQSIINALPEDRGSWEVVVFQNPSPNAFALPGNKIGVHSGMLKVAGSQGQLAAVVAHEVGHLLADHANERLTQQLAVQGGMALVDLFSGDPGTLKYQILRKALGLGADVGILLPFSRTHEKEADAIGLDLMARAGFDPRESIELWENMAAASKGQPVEFLSTHPSHDTRSEELEERMGPALKTYEAAQSRGIRPNCK